jgi:hypothetical protein
MSPRFRMTAVIIALAAVAAAIPSAAIAGTPSHGMAPVYVSGGVHHYRQPPRLVPGQALTTQAQLREVLGPPGLPPVQAAPATRPPRRIGTSNVIENVMEGVASGVITAAVIYVAKKTFKLVKKYIYKGKHGGQLIQNAGDGRCEGGFAKGQVTYLANCGDKTGIYWQYSSGRKLWNTHTGDMLTASSATNGTKPFLWYPAHDWYHWAYGDVCGSCGCTNCLFGIDWALYNSQSHRLSDNAPGS